MQTLVGATAARGLGTSAAMAKRTVGVLVKEGNGAWPPSAPGDVTTFVRGADAASLAAAAPGGVDALVWVPGVPPAELENAHAALAPEWVHSFSAGVDYLRPFLTGAAFAAHPTPTTNGRGAFSSSLAEYVMCAALHFNKQVPRCLKQKTWDQFTMDTVAGKTMGFVGWGHIAKTSAKLAKAFGMRVVACRRNVDAVAAPGEVAPDAVYGVDARRDLFAEADFVVCTLPGTAATADFCGADEFAAMRPSAVFISLGRGAAVDEAALLRALESDAIAGAALDVFKNEPLKDDSPWWRLGDKVLLTPHNADLTADYCKLGWDVFAANNAAWAPGTKATDAAFATPFDPAQGY